MGTRCAVVMMLGGAEGDDPLFMQIKEAGPSVLEPYLGASPHKNHGERVVMGQRMMQAASDILLGWSTFRGRDFYARQLRDMKFSAEVETMNPTLFSLYAELCAATLARAHARTGDSAQIAGYLGNRDVVRPGHSLVCRGLCRPGRTRPCGPPCRHQRRTCASPNRRLIPTRASPWRRQSASPSKKAHQQP